jgi:hypothetical protein
VRARVFTYGDYEVDAGARRLTCHYRSDDVEFIEVASFDETVDLSGTAASGVAILYHLVAGLSYYKAGAARVVDLGEWASAPNGALVARAIRDGLGEFAYRNDLDLADVEVGDEAAARPISAGHVLDRGPLIPFGGGIDSIVTAADAPDDAALFVVGPAEQRFDAIERPAVLTGLPVVRCSRRLDDKIIASRKHGWFDGHVPVTAMVSALAVVAAISQGRNAVVMSNERSSSSPNLVVDGREVNHQWSKSWAFEQALRAWLAGTTDTGLAYYSALRDRSELWVAREFASHPEYFDTFMSCNRAFRQDPAARATTWCGECDKCLFIDLVLAPFVDRSRLELLFAGSEPLGDPRRADELEVLAGLAANPKPFECVGDTDECATALVATAARADRADQGHLVGLAGRLGHARPLEALLAPEGPTNAPERDATRHLV